MCHQDDNTNHIKRIPKAISISKRHLTKSVNTFGVRQKGICASIKTSKFEKIQPTCLSVTLKKWALLHWQPGFL